MFRRKKKKQKDTPIEVIEEAPTKPQIKVRGRKYSVEEVAPDTRGTLPVVKSDADVDYPEVVGTIDKYVVDTRIWDRVERYIGEQLEGVGGDTGPHEHKQYVTKDELASWIGKDEDTYRYHHASMWYEVAAAPGEAWWSDSDKFLLNPADLDGKQPSDVTFAPGKTIGLHFEKKDGATQVAMVHFTISSSEMTEMGYWEVFGEASQAFPGATDNVMVVYATPPEEVQEHEHPYADEDHEHPDYKAKIDHNEDRINALEHELEAIADTKEAGEWECVSPLDFDIRGTGEMMLSNDDLTATENTMTLHTTDKKGVSHEFSGVEEGDLVELVQESTSRSTGDYGLYEVKNVNGMSFTLELQQGRGQAETNKNFFIKFFHLSEGIDLAELDARYASKSHTHSVASHSHPYEQIALSHGEKTYFGRNVNWNNSMYFFPYERRGSNGSLYQGGRIEDMGELQFKNGTNFYAKIGKSGTLIGTTGSSSPNHGTFIVMSVWESTYQSSHSQQGKNIQTFYGTTIWVQDSAKGRNWNDSDSLYWWYRGAGR